VPAAAEGQVLLSFRELAGGTLALLDVETEEIVWATMGPWMSQHDPDVLPNGNLLVFDNRGKFGPGGQTRVLEFNPGNGEIAWTYGGDRNHHFESFIRGSQQRLPNGNTFITEDDGGRLLEVTGDGTIVWEYINPVRDEREGERIPVLSWAQRIDSDTLSAGFRASVEGDTLLAEETNTQ
jgi:outer membrane protein assembly factor BamB